MSSFFDPVPLIVSVGNTANDSDLNGYGTSLDTAFNDVEADITGIVPPFTSGTTMLFFQASAPTGWTKSTSIDDSMLRIVEGSGAGTGGTDSPLSYTIVNEHTHTATWSSVINHRHYSVKEGYSSSTISASYPVIAGQGPTYSLKGNPIYSANTGTTSTDSATGTVTISTDGDLEWSPKYVDIIICVKD